MHTEAAGARAGRNIGAAGGRVKVKGRAKEGVKVEAEGM